MRRRSGLWAAARGRAASRMLHCCVLLMTSELAACSNEGGRQDVRFPFTGDGDRAGEGDGDTGAGGPAPPISGGDGDGVPPTMPRPQVNMMGPDAGSVCSGRSATAEQVVLEEEITVEEEVTSIEPVAMYIMLDQSASMVLLWPAAVTSIQQFVGDPMSSGIDVAMGYFPILGGNCMTGAPYNTPEVPLGSLPGHSQAVIDNLGLHAPFGIGTPTEGALRGVTSFCEDYQLNNPDKKCVAVLISDGAPTDENGTCAVDQATLSGVAGQSFANGVSTYTVGLAGADFIMLDAIATAGGTDCDPNGPTAACDVTAGADKLVEALRAIRDEVVTVETRVETVTKVVETPLECEWQIPEPEVGLTLDFEEVNVKLSSPAQATPTFGKVDGPGDCAENGWHYDDNDMPTRIIACDETCETITTTPQATIDILLGCATVPLK